MNERHDKQGVMSAQQAEREIVALQQTIQRLETELGAAKDRITKLTYYVEVAREFEEKTTHTGPEAAADPSSRPNGADANRRTPKGGISGRAVRECVAILRERRQRIRTRDLHALLQQRGIQLGGQSPINSLSGYLSRTPGLVGDKILGWALEEWGESV